MKKLYLLQIITLLCLLSAQQMSAQTPSFSMAAEEAGKNTPSEWLPVQLPTGLPEFTAANTFNITDYGASTLSADNATAIQAALDAAAAAGGGMVVVPAGTWLTGCLTMGSKTVLHLCEGAMLKMLPHSSFPTDANGYAKMENPFITGKSGASDIVIEGESRTTSIIDGQGAPWWDDVEAAKAQNKSTTRSAMIRFWQGQRYLFRNFRIQNAPNTNITIGRNGNGAHVTAHDIDIKNPASHDVADPSHNTDGFPIWTQYVNIYNCDIDTGDDNVVTDSDAQFVHVWNCQMKAGHGASLGSYTVNMHDIIYEDLTFDGTDAGFRLKSNIDRSGDVYNITFRNCTMTNVASPFVITSWYDELPASPEAAAASPAALSETTPRFHDILIQDVTVSGHTTYKSSDKNYHGIFIYGRPESKIRDVIFDNVDITHSKGLRMNFCEGITFYDNCSYTVYNTNKTEKNGTATDAANGLDGLMEQQYACSYTWHATSGETPGDVKLDATTYSSTTGSDPNLTYVFNNGWTLSNGNNKAYGTGKNNTIKYSRNVAYTINIPAGVAVTSATFTGYGNGTGGCNLGTVNGTDYSSLSFPYDTENMTSYTVDFATPVTGTLTFKPSGEKQACFIITLATVASLTLDESSDNTTLLTENDGLQANVTLTRTLQAGSYNTFAVPFDIDAATLTSTFGSGVKVKKLTASSLSGNALTMTFADATAIEACKPYLIKVPANVENPSFQNVTIHKTPVTAETTYVDFVPTLGLTSVAGTPTDVLYLKAGNKLYHPSVLPAQMKGMRAYFVLKGGSSASSFVIDIDDETTLLREISNEELVMRNDDYYNLAGQRVVQPTKGLYIVNGKKMVIK